MYFEIHDIFTNGPFSVFSNLEYYSYVLIFDAYLMIFDAYNMYINAIGSCIVIVDFLFNSVINIP